MVLLVFFIYSYTRLERTAANICRMFVVARTLSGILRSVDVVMDTVEKSRLLIKYLTVKPCALPPLTHLADSDDWWTWGVYIKFQGLLWKNELKIRRFSVWIHEDNSNKTL